MIEKYNLEKARDEADILKRKISRRKAQNYEEASQQREVDVANEKLVKPLLPQSELIPVQFFSTDKKEGSMYMQNKELFYITDSRKLAVPRFVYELAHKEYAAKKHSSQTLERILQRGGFGANEILELAPPEEIKKLYRQKRLEEIKFILFKTIEDPDNESFFRRFIVSMKEEGLTTDEIGATIESFKKECMVSRKEEEVQGISERFEKLKSLV